MISAECSSACLCSLCPTIHPCCMSALSDTPREWRQCALEDRTECALSSARVTVEPKVAQWGGGERGRRGTVQQATRPMQRGPHLHPHLHPCALTVVVLFALRWRCG